MSSHQERALHVAAALNQTGAEGASIQPATPSSRQVAAHVQAAINAPAAGAAATPDTLQPNPPGPLDAYAAHVQTAIQFKSGAAESSAEAAGAGIGDWVAYPEKKGMRIPPPPQKPVYSLTCGDKGQGCQLRSLETGRVQQAGTMFAGYVRMSKGGEVYVSPRTGVGNAGDSHPSIASMSPEWRSGQRAVVAGGEVGIIDNVIVGHNDKTGHFQTRRNLAQSGMPGDRFHPFTEDAKSWFKAETSGEGGEGSAGDGSGK